MEEYSNDIKSIKRKQLLNYFTLKPIYSFKGFLETLEWFQATKIKLNIKALVLLIFWRKWKIWKRVINYNNKFITFIKKHNIGHFKWNFRTLDFWENDKLKIKP